MPALLEFADTTTLTAALCHHVVHRLKEDLARQDRAVLVVSGGKSPVPLFKALAQQPLAWDRVVITLADERWVPPGHADSNEALVRAHLLKHQAAEARLLAFWNGDPAPETGAAALVAELATLPRPFSQVILGMGEDGHVASLFPDAAELADGLRTAAPTLAVRPTHAPHPRVSLSLAALLDSRDIALMLSGQAKRRVLERALGGGTVEELPVRAILRQTVTPVSVFWAA